MLNSSLISIVDAELAALWDKAEAYRNNLPPTRVEKVFTNTGHGYAFEVAEGRCYRVVSVHDTREKAVKAERKHLKSTTKCQSVKIG